MTEEVQQPPEAALIEEARLRLPKTRSAVTKVAKRAGISEARWRQIAKGYQQATKETRVPVRAPAETLARMAEAVNVSAHQLDAVGRSDAAQVIRGQRRRMAEGLASLIPTTELGDDVEGNTELAAPSTEAQGSDRNVAAELLDLIERVFPDEQATAEERAQLQRIKSEVLQADRLLSPLRHLPEVAAQQARTLLQLAFRAMDLIGTIQKRRPDLWPPDETWASKEAARSGVPGLRLSEVNEHSVKTETVLPHGVYTAGFNTAGETASPLEGDLFVATSGSSASAIPGLHVAWPKIDFVVDLPELPDREPVTEGLAPRIDSDVLEGWSDAMDDLHEKFSALQRVAKSGAESGANPDVAVRAFLTAVDIYAFATRELVSAMQAVDLYASEEQIRTGLVTFDYNIELATLYLPLVEAIEKSAPNKRLKVLPSRSAEGLRALVSSLRAAHDAWIDAGLSSEHPAAAMRALAAAARTAPPGYVGPGQATRDAQDQAGEDGLQEG